MVGSDIDDDEVPEVPVEWAWPLEVMNDEPRVVREDTEPELNAKVRDSVETVLPDLAPTDGEVLSFSARLLEQVLDERLERLQEQMRVVIRQELGNSRKLTTGSSRSRPPSLKVITTYADSAGVPADPKKHCEAKPPTSPTIYKKSLTSTIQENQNKNQSLEVYEEVPTMIEALTTIFPVFGRLVDRVSTRLSVIGKSSAPYPESCFSRLVDGPTFHLIVYLVIMLNVAFMVYASDKAIAEYDKGPSDFVNKAEIAFLAVYSVEFLMRLWRFGRYYWIDAQWSWNWLDAFILVVTYYEVTLESSLPNISFLRMVRLFKLAKVLRVLRVVRMFKTLRSILNAIISTVDTLIWSMLMLYVIIFMSALTFTLVVGNYLLDEGTSMDPEMKQQLNEHFGSVGKASLSLYSSVTGGNDWSVYYDALKSTGALAPAVFLFFIFFVQVAVLNIILGFFVDVAMRSMHSTPEEEAQEHLDTQLKMHADLASMIESTDENHDSMTSMPEWRMALRRGAVLGYLDMLGFRRRDVLHLFNALWEESDNQEVSLQTFVEGCVQMRGQASRFDVYAIQCELKELKDMVNGLS